MAYARSRVHELVRGTGMSAAEVVEDALRGYVPPGVGEPAKGLVRRGSILVVPAWGRRVTQMEAVEALEAVRGRDL